MVLFSICASYNEIYRYFPSNYIPHTFSFSLRESSFSHDLIIINILFYFIICIYILKRLMLLSMEHSIAYLHSLKSYVELGMSAAPSIEV